MRTIEVFQFLQRKILVTRESPSAVRGVIESAIGTDGEVALDFNGIHAVTPSFVDEILAIIDDARASSSRQEVRVVFLHAPTPLSAKYLAIGKRHGVTLSQSGSDAWEIKNAATVGS
jgi:hypothetical protein